MSDTRCVPFMFRASDDLDDLDITLNESSDLIFENQFDIDPDKNLFSHISNECKYMSNLKFLKTVHLSQMEISTSLK